jgi:hypothetical protein
VPDVFINKGLKMKNVKLSKNEINEAIAEAYEEAQFNAAVASFQKRLERLNKDMAKHNIKFAKNLEFQDNFRMTRINFMF